MRGTCPKYITMMKLAIITTVDPARTFSDLYLLFCKAQTECSGHPAKNGECGSRKDIHKRWSVSYGSSQTTYRLSKHPGGRCALRKVVNSGSPPEVMKQKAS